MLAASTNSYSESPRLAAGPDAAVIVLILGAIILFLSGLVALLGGIECMSRGPEPVVACPRFAESGAFYVLVGFSGALIGLAAHRLPGQRKLSGGIVIASVAFTYVLTLLSGGPILNDLVFNFLAIPTGLMLTGGGLLIGLKPVRGGACVGPWVER